MNKEEQKSKADYDKKRFIYEVKAFVWFLVTEPPRVIVQFLRQNSYMLNKTTKTKFWIMVFLILAGFSVHLNSPMKWPFIILLLISIFKYEWESKLFIHRWREVKEHGRQ